MKRRTCPKGHRRPKTTAGRKADGQCPFCWLVLHPRRTKANGRVRTFALARRPLPCVHVGDELTGAERDALGLDHRRRWTRCDHPNKPLGEAVCGCRGCGPKCPGYTTGADVRTSHETTAAPAAHRLET